MRVMTAQLRTWYLIAFSMVPPLWAATNWHQYTHVVGVPAASYVALLVSPALFVLGARRPFDELKPDASLELDRDASWEE
jgi:hypothetical protein